MVGRRYERCAGPFLRRIAAVLILVGKNGADDAKECAFWGVERGKKEIAQILFVLSVFYIYAIKSTRRDAV